MVTSTAIGLASLSASAGVIHAALTPSHMGEWALEGAGFAVAAWLQLGVAAALVRRRSVAALQVAIVSNLAFIALWLMSRTRGFPFGPHAGHAESFSFVDEVTVTAEAALVIGAFAAIVRPCRGVANGWQRAVVPVIAVVAATAALLSPSARNHAHDAHGDHHGQSAVDAKLFPNGDDKGFALLHNGQHAHAEPYKLDPASQMALDAQLAITRQVAKLYPTVAAAEGAGYHRTGPYIPGLGVHYIRFTAGTGIDTDGVLDENDLLHPLSLQFSGVSPNSELAGFMYYSVNPTEPVGFVGRNDVWHYHKNLCLALAPDHVDAPFGLDNEATNAQCEAAGGQLLKQTSWMLHVWSVPGYGNPYGVFGENSPKLACSDGSYFILPAKQWASHRLNVCAADAS